MKTNVTLHDAAAIIITESMTTAAKRIKADFSKMFNIDGPEVDVKMTVNGVEVPVTDTLNEMWKRENKRIDERAEKLAIEMVKGAGLDRINDILGEAESKLQEYIDKQKA